jgi:hypothetical protein
MLNTIVCVVRQSEKLSVFSLMNGMQKSQIDNYVNENYQLLLKVSSDFVRRKKRNFDPEIVISEAYIHVLKCKDKIETIGQLQSYFFSKINLEICKQNSVTNYQFKERHSELIGIERQEENNILLEIEHDIKRNSQKAQIEAYRLNLKCSIKKIIFEAYFVKRYRTVRDFAKYFNLSKQTANDLINEMKNEIRNHGK